MVHSYVVIHAVVGLLGRLDRLLRVMRRYVLLPGMPLLYYGLAAGRQPVPLRAAGRLLKRRLSGTRRLGRTSALLGWHGAVVLLRGVRAHLPRLALGGREGAAIVSCGTGGCCPGGCCLGWGGVGSQAFLTGRHGTVLLSCCRGYEVRLPLHGMLGRGRLVPLWSVVRRVLLLWCVHEWF